MPDDERDERLAERLAVEPLDVVTRRRLVTTALRADSGVARGGATRRRLPLAVAAAFAAVVAGGLAFLAVQDDDTTPTASRPSAADTASPAAGTDVPPEPGDDERAAAEVSPRSGSLDDAKAGPAHLGDVGDLRDRATLERVRTTVRYTTREQQLADSFAAEPSPGAGAQLLDRLADAGCVDELPGGELLALGTGRLGVRDAIVVVVAAPGGEPAISAIVLDGCTVRALD